MLLPAFYNSKLEFPTAQAADPQFSVRTSDGNSISQCDVKLTEFSSLRSSQPLSRFSYSFALLACWFNCLTWMPSNCGTRSSAIHEHTLETSHCLNCKFMTSTPFPLDHYHIICTGIYQMPSHAFSLKFSVQCYPSPFGRNFPSETFEIQMTSALALCVSKCYWLSGASTVLIDAAWLPDSGSLQNRCFRQPSRKMVS